VAAFGPGGISVELASPATPEAVFWALERVLASHVPTSAPDAASAPVVAPEVAPSPVKSSVT
jgi:xanthine dehydrogenase large subunit